MMMANDLPHCRLVTPKRVDDLKEVSPILWHYIPYFINFLQLRDYCLSF